MKRLVSGVAAVLAIAVLSACGSSSGVTEDEAADLVRDNTHAAPIDCVKSPDDDRVFDCTAIGAEAEEISLNVTIGESGDSLFVNDCEPIEGPDYGVKFGCEGIS